MTSEDPQKQSDSTQAQPAAKEYEQAARALAQEGRWDDLAALFIECAGSDTTASGRAGYLALAAKVFEENLNDLERAYIALLTAFQDDPANQELTAEISRLAGTLGRFPELLQECMSVAPQLSPPISNPGHGHRAGRAAHIHPAHRRHGCGWRRHSHAAHTRHRRCWNRGGCAERLDYDQNEQLLLRPHPLGLDDAGNFLENRA